MNSRQKRQVAMRVCMLNSVYDLKLNVKDFVESRSSFAEILEDLKKIQEKALNSLKSERSGGK